jgi:hypothetical protein
MKKLLIAALAATTALAAVPALADDHHGDHRGGYGHGHHGGPAIVVGNFYSGHGYWDGHRYWQHRDRFNGGWRYR